MSLNLSLIIPCYNMEDHLPRLFNSLANTAILALLDELIFVDDGSTDRTSMLLSDFANNHVKFVKIITLERNEGRFRARWEGAKSSSCEKILFLDTRLELEPGFVEGLIDLVPKYDSVMGVVNIDTTSSIFSLYWDRTHKVLFRKHFEAASQGFLLTKENYDNYLKGTTVFLCKRLSFIHACESFKDVSVLSDDMALLKVIVQDSPIWVDSRLTIRWWPRQNFGEFLLRLWERGPSFVEYHFFLRKSGHFFWVVLLGIIVSIVVSALVYFFPVLAFASVVFIFIVALLSVFIFAHSIREAMLIAPLHLAAIFTFGVAILRGIIVNGLRILRGNFPAIK